jgi:exodeoxyribonuclease VII large subunit
MRRRLEAEGLFDPVHKRPLPFLPRRIGLVTSASGAALHDFLRGLRRRAFGVEVLLWDARVQGDLAWREIVRGLHLLASRDRVDVIVIARGGGSLEDLWTFNTEPLARAIFELETPVVSAIGHEVDVVLSDLVADVRAPTPTAAAELVAPDGAALRARLAELRTRLAGQELGRLRALRLRLEALERGLVHPAHRLAALDGRLVALRQRLGRAMQAGRTRHDARLGLASGRLDALSPLAVLGRGYAIATSEGDGRILRSAAEVSAGAPIRVRLSEGSLRARVMEAADG